MRRYGRISRRSFVSGTLGAGALLAVAPSLKSANVEVRTMFFNLSQHDTNTPHFLSIAGQHFRLQPVSQNPALLTQARVRNNFLAQVPDQHITHFLQNLSLPTDFSTLGYVYSNPNTTTGTYSLDYVIQYVPRPGLANAYHQSRTFVSAGPLPLSTKRALYNAAPALTLQDFEDEQELIDGSDLARTLVGMHPEFLAANVDAAAKVQYTYISQAQYTQDLADLLISLGPAQPQGTAVTSNQPGWATLIPYMDGDNQPIRNSVRLNQYDTEWHPDLAPAVVKAIFDINPRVKNDKSLGADVTELDESLDRKDLAGKIWFRHNGFASITKPVQTSLNLGRDVPSVTFNTVNSSTGIQFIHQPTAVANGDTLTVTLNTIRNWFLRFLSVYLQFKDVDGNILDPAKLPENIVGNFKYAPGLVYSNAVSAGFISPPPTVAGIPIPPAADEYSLTLNLPASVSSISIFFAGIGNTSVPPGTLDDNWQILGTTLTGLINYVVVVLLMAAGALPDITPLVRFLVQLALTESLLPLIGLAGNNVFDGGKVNIQNLCVNITRGLLTAATVPILARVIAIVTQKITVAQLLDSVPVVGQIARAAAAVIGALQLAQTSIEVAISPRIYGFGLTLTHTVTVTIFPDMSHGVFPVITSDEILYYRTFYLFSSGSVPHKGDPVDLVNPSSLASFPVTIKDIPSGGNIEVRIALYVRKQGTSPDNINNFCAANGSTGLTNNTVDHLPDVRVAENRRPINNNTTYQHVMKTVLDASGAHVWKQTSIAPVYVQPAGNQAPGSLGALRNITVRQQTGTQPGYLGYAWQSYSSGLNDCLSNAPAQVDVAANLNTSTLNNGAAAQTGYARVACGLSGAAQGVSVSYSLLSSDAQNFYVDTDAKLLRQVNLSNPSFADPDGKQKLAFGAFNFNTEKVVLHPSGHFVSINNTFHKCEAHQLPGSPLPDEQATQRLIANPFSGLGSRPGLITSPVSLAASVDGHVLVLEDSAYNNRIQAMDLGGNPIPLFKNQKMPYFLELTGTAAYIYLDIAVEFSGFIYVLAQSQDASEFRVDIYHPDQQGTNPISTTRGIYGAKIAVDYWRGLYTLNYEVLLLPNGNVPSVTEPSVSYWYPQQKS